MFATQLSLPWNSRFKVLNFLVTSARKISSLNQEKLFRETTIYFLDSNSILPSSVRCTKHPSPLVLLSHLGFVMANCAIPDLSKGLSTCLRHWLLSLKVTRTLHLTLPANNCKSFVADVICHLLEKRLKTDWVPEVRASFINSLLWNYFLFLASVWAIMEEEVVKLLDFCSVFKLRVFSLLSYESFFPPEFTMTQIISAKELWLGWKC